MEKALFINKRFLENKVARNIMYLMRNEYSLYFEYNLHVLKVIKRWCNKSHL